jgi:tetratricopeptide (TPR) repeat protein
MERLDQADKLLRERKYLEAIALCEEVHQAYPDEESVLLLLAWAHYDNGAPARALEYLEILLARELSRKIFTGFAFDELVRIYKQEKNFVRLTQICENAVAVQPEDIGLLTELGNAYLQAGRSDDACRIYEKLVRLENDNPAFYCLLGEALFAAGRTIESKTAFLKASAIDPDQADYYHYKIAGLFARGGYTEEAKKLLAACIAAKPANPLYHCALGDLLIGLGQIQEALIAYETAAQSDHSGAGAYFNRLGNSFMKEKLFDQAANAFQKAIDCEALLPYYENLAAALRATGQNNPAQTTLIPAGAVKKGN